LITVRRLAKCGTPIRSPDPTAIDYAYIISLVKIKIDNVN
jgi:hypothetical protein